MEFVVKQDNVRFFLELINVNNIDVNLYIWKELRGASCRGEIVQCNLFHLTCIHNSINIAALLINKFKFDVQLKDDSEDTLLANSLEASKYNPNVNENVNVGDTTLYWKNRSSSPSSSVSMEVSHHENDNLSDLPEHSPLQSCSEHGSTNSVKTSQSCFSFSENWGDTLENVSLQSCCDYDSTDSRSETVSDAFSENSMKRFENGAKINEIDSEGNKPLHVCALYDSVDVMKLILQHGVNINERSALDRTAFDICAEENSVNSLKLLLQHADIDDTCILDMTALHTCASKGNVDVLKILLLHGFNVNLNRSYGKTPLHDCIVNDSVEAMKLLIEHGADVNAKDHYGDTPLHIRAFNTLYIGKESHIECMAKILLEHGASINDKNKKGDTPLHICARSRNLIVMKVLLQQGGIVNLKNKHGDTPLHHAARGNNVEEIELLLNHGSDINVLNDNNETPLHKSTYGNYGNIHAMEALLEHSADANIKNSNGKTPLEIAIKKKSTDLIKLLRKHSFQV